MKQKKKIAKKENLYKYPPAINSSPKNPECLLFFKCSGCSKPNKSTPKLYWTIKSTPKTNDSEAAEIKKYFKFKKPFSIINETIKNKNKYLKYKIDFQKLFKKFSGSFSANK